ncbi:hypothetical protein [Roseospira navarrensis]|uniref:Uncharacterized protein n=1 Tax=Roseospira navarrensis TaxID=140058 RepID=A0A7X2D5P0_9PROT|nr:hypothetical protein [Roseospira navarrensis]MQX37435.1 hypothetical protein [Roseospira navarrensis]
MSRTVIPFPAGPVAAGSPGETLLEAARTWRRFPGCPAPFPDGVVRQLGAAGLLGALMPLDALMVVLAARGPAARPLALGSVGTPADTQDARLLAGALAQAVRDGAAGDEAVERLARRLDLAGPALLDRALRRLGRAVRPRVARGAWPEAGRGLPVDVVEDIGTETAPPHAAE